MKTVQKIVPETDICHIIKCVDKDDVKTLTHLRKMIESKELAAGALLRGIIRQYCKGCVCKETVYILVGISLQFGAKIDECSLCCIDALEIIEHEAKHQPKCCSANKPCGSPNCCSSIRPCNKPNCGTCIQKQSCVQTQTTKSNCGVVQQTQTTQQVICESARITERNCTFREVKATLIVMSNVNNKYGICPLSQEMRNWLGSVLNRDDMFEGGIGPIPCVFMKECKCDMINSSLARSIATGSQNFYKGMVHYAKLVDCSIYNKMLKQIVELGIKFLDLTPIIYAIQEGGDPIKVYVIKMVGETEPKDEPMREALIRLSNVISTM